MKAPGLPRDTEVEQLRRRVAELERTLADTARSADTLPESEEMFRTLVGNVPGAVYRSEASAPWRDLFVSHHVEALCGYAARDLTRPGGLAFGDLILPEDRHIIEESVAQAANRGGTFEIRYRIRHADGGIRWVHDQGRVVEEPEGTPRWLEGVVVDITDRMSVEVALRESEERFRTLVANVPGAVYRSELLPPYRDIFVSEGVFQITGYTAAEALASDRVAFGHLTLPEDRAIVDAAVAAAVRDHGVMQVQYRLRHADGSIRWVHEQARASYQPDGAPRWLEGVIVDITDRRRVEVALQESEERYRTLVASVPGAVYLRQVEAPWKDTFMSDGVRALTGYQPRDFLRADGITFNDLTLPEDLPGVIAQVDAALERRQPFAVRYRIRHADGGVRWVYDRGQAAYGPEGGPVFLGGVILDITDRITAEEAVRASQRRLVEAQRIAHVGSWELDLRTNALVWSEEIYRMFEMNPQEFGATYEAFLNAVHPDDREAVNQAFSTSLRDHSPYQITHRLQMPDGRVKVVEERAEIFYDEEGRPFRSAGTVQDVTEERHAEEARQLLEAQLQQAQKMEAIGTLAGGIAHDFNNILAAVIMHAELLKEDLAAEEAGSEHISGILDASQRARDLVQQILTFSRLRKQERRPVSLDVVVGEALKLLRATLPSTIEIRAEIAADEYLVLADHTQMHQIMVNLCTNAAHAMRESGGVLDVRYKPILVDERLAARHAGLRPGTWVRLEVSDTGHGMDPSTLERIFDPFFTTKGPREGTGLGLAVVHGIMRNHEGIVTVTSEPGKGTTFHLYFPAIEGRTAAQSPEDATIPTGKGQHLLVIDDEPVLTRLVARSLERLGYRVTAHTQATEALVDFMSRPDEFDLVFSDLTMPRITGVELAGQILRRRPDIPVLLTSGYSGSLDPQELQRLGVRELVGKPFVTRIVAEAIARQFPKA